MTSGSRNLGTRILGLLLFAGPLVANAVPSFARQTGMAGHTVWPELTHCGRVFKASDYVIDNLKQVKGVTSHREEILEVPAFLESQP